MDQRAAFGRRQIEVARECIGAFGRLPSKIRMSHCLTIGSP